MAAYAIYDEVVMAFKFVSMAVDKNLYTAIVDWR